MNCWCLLPPEYILAHVAEMTDCTTSECLNLNLFVPQQIPWLPVALAMAAVAALALSLAPATLVTDQNKR
jgi:hypothetical protein